jgi:hypothetical protein
MPIKSEKTASNGGAQPTLGDLIKAVDGLDALSETRRRDLRSAVKRVASLSGDDPGRIPLDLSALGARLARVNPIAARARLSMRSGSG